MALKSVNKNIKLWKTLVYGSNFSLLSSVDSTILDKWISVLH